MEKHSKADPAVAKRAIENFRNMIPSLEGLASALSGKKLSIQVGTMTYTDGRTLHISPPYSLGLERVHDRTLCDKRTDYGAPMCTACMSYENVMALVYHELSHVLFGSMDKLTVDSVNLIRALPITSAEQLASEVHKQVTRMSNPYAPRVAGRISKYLPFLANAFEDIRVDAAMMASRPGVYYMQQALRHGALVEGWINPDTQERMFWKDQPLNSQIAIAFIAMANLDSVEGVFDKSITHLVDSDAKLQELALDARSAATVDESFATAVEALIYLKSKGFFADDYELGKPIEEDSDDRESDSSEGVREPGGGGTDGGGAGGSVPSVGAAGRSDGVEPEGEGVDHKDGDEREGGDASVGDDLPAIPSASDLDGEGSGGLSDVDGADGSSGDDAGSAHDGERDGPGGADDSTEDDVAIDPSKLGDATDVSEALKLYLGHGTDNEIESEDNSAEVARLMKAVGETIDFFDEPSKDIVSVQMVTDAESFPRQGTQINTIKSMVPESILSPAMMHMRRAIEENKRSSMDRNRRSGRVNSRVLGRRAWNDDDRLFQRKTIPGKRDYAVLIGIDISGSTSSVGADGDWMARPSAGAVNSCTLAVAAAYAQATLCQRLGLRFAVYAHTGTHSSLRLYQVKSFSQPWNSESMYRLGKLRPQQANLDGHTLEVYRKMVEKENVTDRIIMYYSDGAMPAENYAEELDILKSEIKICKKKDITLMAVGVRTSDPVKHGLDTARIDSVNDIPRVVQHLGKRVADS